MTYRSKILSYLNRGSLEEILGNPYIMVCDSETTGFSEKMHDMITFSASIHDFSLDKKDEITVYARPKRDRWTKGAEKVHGFTLNEALEFPDPRRTAIKLLHFLKPFKADDNKPILFVSHDTSGFDSRFFKAFFLNQLLIDSYFKVFKDEYKLSTINMARKLGYKKTSLDVMAEIIGMELNHHEVQSDREVCFGVFKYLLDKTEAQLEIEVEKTDYSEKTAEMQRLQQSNI